MVIRGRGRGGSTVDEEDESTGSLGSVITDNPKFPLEEDCIKGNAMQNWDPLWITNQYLALFSNKFKESMVCPCHCRSRTLCLESIFTATMVHITDMCSCWTSASMTLHQELTHCNVPKNVTAYAGLRGTPTTFSLTPKAVSATLLLKMNREVFNVAHGTTYNNSIYYTWQKTYPMHTSLQ